jgi:dTDP-4-dehydrorhamnose reductase
MSRETTLELWGGVECTVNRVHDEYFNQLERNGHAERIEDLDLFAQLGIRALRYPVLWESTAPDGPQSANWTWPDERLSRLRNLGIRPIVGLVHHGSGPRHTSLVDPSFPPQLAEFARAVAERYPWVQDYTPVNEPLTTARFSGQYGHWYPHGQDGQTWAKCLLTQCRAVVLSMRAIREVNPQARLIQTEDLGKTHSTRALAYQAEFENVRRWLSLDLLCGKVDRDHRMWQFLLWLGVEENELQWFLDNPCPPDIIGINHYLTSERFLDEHIARYPENTHGGNGRDVYADVEAVRVCASGADGPMVLLRETWERFGLPIAVTEAHLGSTREEQLRWMHEVWTSAQQLRRSGVDLRAVTAWSLLGAYDWHCLLARCENMYEPGVFDLRGGQPRPTAIAGMLKEFAAGRDFEHPVLSVPGWWRRPHRLLYPTRQRYRARDEGTSGTRLRWKFASGPSSPVLVNGATGTLGRAFARLCDHRGLNYELTTRQQMDIGDPASIEAMLDATEPWAVVNTAGYVRVDDAEREPEACLRENSEGPTHLARACRERGIPFVTFSSDLVFDGSKGKPYVESDPVAPLNVYGHSKARAEQCVLAEWDSSLVVRTSAFFGAWDEHNFVLAALREVAQGRPFAAADDMLISPTYVPDLVHATLDLLIDGERGIWHLANQGVVTWAELARQAVEMADLDTSLIEGRPGDSFGWPAPRPEWTVLSSERGLIMPTLERGLDAFFFDCEFGWKRAEAEPMAQSARESRLVA